MCFLVCTIGNLSVSPFQPILFIVLTAFPWFQVFQYYLVQFCTSGIHNSFLQQPEEKKTKTKTKICDALRAHGFWRRTVGRAFLHPWISHQRLEIPFPCRKPFWQKQEGKKMLGFGFFSNSKAWNKRFPASHTAQVFWDLSLPAHVQSLLKAIELYLGKMQGI